VIMGTPAYPIALHAVRTSLRGWPDWSHIERPLLMPSKSEASPSSVTPSGSWTTIVFWLGVCALAGLLITPIFHSMPPRMKFLGIHSWGLATCLSVVCSWLAHAIGVRSRSLIIGVSVIVCVASLLMLSHWGYADLKLETARRTPLIPLPVIGSPEQMAQSIQLQKELARAMVPTFTDYQRRRMNSPALKRIRPLALWGGEILISVAVCIIVSSQVQRRLSVAADSASLRTMDE
jgi:hypothetical protein